ncbi:ATPase and permease component of ABC-type transporter involved in cytochrome bd biosynthesis [Thermobacillus composti KWC4]|uniref:ATPase and permease component of ABC-type transporter involved in cytochrome bd biosynthesis n=1 Tax=Thermobacillus composti (strain DSM 18247 / JCM 13945 / KWC4) TaxID=717605 RepID=L0EBA2_THECK|nr:ABC transporter ATP-binding protein/permease [Thermobacillus composti]AGA57087.1 ATPase and permease component of ABC-type transporter involved in cytochrome bd biosynthesis [Thermobacillus composti KWC4]
MDRALFKLQGVRPVLLALSLLSLLQGAAIIGQALWLAESIALLFHGRPVGQAVQPLVLFAAAYAARHTFAWLARLVAGRFAEQTGERLRRRLLKRLFERGPGYAAQTGSGRLVTLALDGADRFRTYLELAVSRMLDMMLITSTLLAAVYSLDPASGLILTVTMPVLIGFFILLGMAARKTADRQWRSYQVLSHHFTDTLRGLATLKLLGRSRAYAATVERVSDRYRSATMRTLRVAFLSSFALDFFSTLSVAFVAVGLGLRLINGGVGLETALAVLLLAPEYFLPVRMLGADYHASLDGKEAWAAIRRVIEADERDEEGRGAGGSSGGERAMGGRDADVSGVNRFDEDGRSADGHGANGHDRIRCGVDGRNADVSGVNRFGVNERGEDDVDGCGPGEFEAGGRSTDRRGSRADSDAAGLLPPFGGKSGGSGKGDRETAAEQKRRFAGTADLLTFPENSVSAIELLNVEVAGDEGIPRLSGITASIGREIRKVGIVGMSGAGKTTMLHLLGGFLTPSSGVIQLDGCPLAGETKRKWQRQLAFIPQHPYLFSGTLADNVRFYEPDASEERVMEALDAVGLGDLVRQLPNGIYERIGEGGRALSGGQAQRVALARALAGQRSVLLLDEPTAHLDIETELELKHTLLSVFGDRRVFLATHRLHWMKEMDWIWLLKDGRLAEAGTHEQLTARSGIYSELLAAAAGGGSKR